MLPVTISEIVHATQGTLVIGDPRSMVGWSLSDRDRDERSSNGICIDSRNLQRGDVFIALKGDRTDGHQFLNESIRKGAALCIVSKIPAKLTLSSSDSVSVLQVKDTKKALMDVAKYYRQKYADQIQIVGITGSCGKTTVKEMLSQILNRYAPTVHTVGNFNNEIGCPLSIYSLNSNHRFGVFEIGASAKGDVKRLAEIVSPHLAIITNIGLEHTATFGSIEDIADGESEILTCLPENGFAVLPADDPFFEYLKAKLPRGTNALIESFGLSKKASVYATNLSMWPGPPTFTLIHQTNNGKISDQFDCTLPVMGRFNILNACAAAAASFCLKIPSATIQDGLRNFSSPNMRFQILRLESGATIVNDCYNANPSSMRNSLESFVESFPQKERCAVLGDMLELGEISRKEHHDLGKFLAGLPLTKIILFGSQVKFIMQGAKESFQDERTISHCTDMQTLIESVRKMLKPESVIFFKASRGIHLEEVIQNITGMEQ